MELDLLTKGTIRCYFAQWFVTADSKRGWNSLVVNSSCVYMHAKDGTDPGSCGSEDHWPILQSWREEM